MKSIYEVIRVLIITYKVIKANILFIFMDTWPSSFNIYITYVTDNFFARDRIIGYFLNFIIISDVIITNILLILGPPRNAWRFPPALGARGRPPPALRERVLACVCVPPRRAVLLAPARRARRSELAANRSPPSPCEGYGGFKEFSLF